MSKFQTYLLAGVIILMIFSGALALWDIFRPFPTPEKNVEENIEENVTKEIQCTDWLDLRIGIDTIKHPYTVHFYENNSSEPTMSWEHTFGDRKIRFSQLDKIHAGPFKIVSDLTGETLGTVYHNCTEWMYGIHIDTPSQCEFTYDCIFDGEIKVFNKTYGELVELTRDEGLVCQSYTRHSCITDNVSIRYQEHRDWGDYWFWAEEDWTWLNLTEFEANGE